MGRHFDKQIEQAQEVVASVGQKAESPEPMTRQEIESFVKGFGVSQANARRIAERWVADRDKSYDAGWKARADAEYESAW